MNDTLLLNMENLSNQYLMQSDNPFLSYDQIVKEVCSNVDERVKYLAILIPILWMGGNWLYNKSKDGKFIDRMDKKKFIIYFPNIPYSFKGKREGEGWFIQEKMSFRDIVTDFIVPIFRVMTLFAMGFMVYYTQISGTGG